MRVPMKGVLELFFFMFLLVNITEPMKGVLELLFFCFMFHGSLYTITCFMKLSHYATTHDSINERTVDLHHSF